MAWARSALALSRVTMIGGLGLFFDPAGRPRGRRMVSPSTVAETGGTAFETLVGVISIASILGLWLVIALSCS